MVLVVEVVVVEDKADRQALDDEGREIGTLPTPLLLGVFLDQFLVDILTYQHLCLLFEIAGLSNAIGLHLGNGLGFLLVDLGLCLLGGGDAPHLVEGVHVKGQVVEFALVVGHGGVGVAVELDDGVHEVPHLLVGGVEDMGAVFVDINAFDILAIYIATEVGAFVNDEAFLACLTGFVGEGGAEEAGAYYQIIVFLIHFSHTESICFRSHRSHRSHRFMGSRRNGRNGRNYPLFIFAGRILSTITKGPSI